MQLIIELKNKFGVELTFDQIFEAPNVRDLARLIGEMRKGEQQKHIRDDVSTGRRTELLEQIGKTRIQGEESGGAQDPKEFRLPSGVLPLQKTVSSKPIFWVHYLNVSLDRALGEDRPMIFLILTPEDIDALGEKPTLNSVAARFVKKIVMTQPHGPYTIGGFCIGAVLAYEIAVQLRREGHVVASLMMLDAPGPSYLKMQGPLSPTLSNPLYIIKRMIKLGLHASWLRIRGRAAGRLRQFGLGETKAESLKGQKLIEVAASTYHGETYDGRALLLLAADNAPHINFLPEWQALIPNNLHFEYIDGHHSELMNEPHVQRIANAINAHLESASLALPGPFGPDIDFVPSSKDDQSGVGLQDVNTVAGNLYPTMPTELDFGPEGNLQRKQR